MKPLKACITNRASDYSLYSSTETADVVARAAVTLCSKEEGAYRSALYELATIMTSFDAKGHAEQMHQKLLDLAVTTIIGQRQRLNNPPPQSPASPPSNPATKS